MRFGVKKGVIRKVTKICAWCKHGFLSWPSQKRMFCSNKCRGLEKRTVFKRPCDVCGKVFDPFYGGQKRCSRRCNSRLQIKASSTRNCSHCDKPFLCYRKPKKTGLLFCSTRCYGDFLKAESDKKNVSKCINCGKEYVVPTNGRKPNDPRGRKFCNRKCMFLYIGKRSKHGSMSYEEHLAGVAVRRWAPSQRRQHNPLSDFTNVDIYVPSKKLCIYVDGVYWHRNFKIKDRRQSKVLRAAGFKVLRISDIQVRKLGIDGFRKFLKKKYGS